jgi:MFS family permease
MSSYLSILQRRPAFRSLWLAQVVSLTGDWFNTIASVILVNRYLDSGLAVGGLLLARALPPFLFGPLAGVVADRFNRKYILFISDVLRAVIVGLMLFVDRPERAWLLFVLSVLQFSISAFFEPARASMLPNLVEPDELLTANTLSSTTWSAMLALGAAIGGFTAAVFGTQTALIIDVCSFVLSALLVITINYQPLAREASAHTSGFTDFWAGIAYVRQNPRIGMMILVKALGQVGSTDIIAASFAARVFMYGEGGALTLGAMFAAFGIGAILGPVVGNALGVKTRRSLQVAINIAYACIPIAWFIIGFAPTLPIVLIGCVLRGMAGSVNWTYSDVLVQMSTPDRFMGRVYSLDFALFTLAFAISVWFSGVALDQTALDARTLCIYFALISLIPLIFWTVLTQKVKLGELQTARADM